MFSQENYSKYFAAEGEPYRCQMPGAVVRRPNLKTWRRCFQGLDHDTSTRQSCYTKSGTNKELGQHNGIDTLNMAVSNARCLLYKRTEERWKGWMQLRGAARDA